MTSVLKVDNIQNSAGTSAISIDSSGNISTTGHVSQGKVYLCSAAWDQTSTTSKDSRLGFTGYETADHSLQSGSRKIIYRDDYNMLNASTGYVTIPADGVWMIVGMYTDATGSASRRIGALWVNDIYYGEWCESYGQYDDATATRILKLEANDTIMFGNNATLGYDDFAFEIARIG